MTCPKPEVLSQWADGSLNPHEALSVSRHAETCDACRRKAQELRAVGAWISSAGEPGRACLSADDMAAVLEGGRVPAHVRTCPRCASEFRALRGAERKATRRRKKAEQSPVTAWAAAAAIFIAIGILIAVASQQTTPKQDPVVQINVNPQRAEPRRIPDVPVAPIPSPKAPPVETAKDEPLRANPLAPRTPSDPITPDPVVKQPETPVAPKQPTVVENPSTPVKPSVDAPHVMAALNVRAGALSSLSDGKWVKATKFEEGMALRAEGRTQLEFAQARITLDPASKFTLVLDEQKIVPVTASGRVVFICRPDRFVVDEGIARIKDTVLAEGVEHVVKKGKVEPQKRRLLPAAARPIEKVLWTMKLGNENIVRGNLAGHIERDAQGTKFLVSDTIKNGAIFHGAASYFTTGDEPPLFTVKPNTALRFHYYLSSPGYVELVAKNISKDENFNLPLETVARQWTTVTVYARDIPVNSGGKKVTCELGDKYLGVTWFVGKPNESCELYIDRFEILEIDR